MSLGIFARVARPRPADLVLHLAYASRTPELRGTQVSRWYTAAFHAQHPDRIAAARAMVTSTPAEGYAGCCEALAAMDLGSDLAAITAPTLAIAGADDLATPPPHLERIAQGIRDAQLLVVAHAAHLANDEQPEIITQALLGHLAAEPVSGEVR
jgi:3-oxoadipate enol-lactonase